MTSTNGIATMGRCTRFRSGDIDQREREPERYREAGDEDREVADTEGKREGKRYATLA